MTWNGERLPIRSVIYRQGEYLYRARFLPLFVNPEPEYPTGRKGLVMAAGWEVLGKRAKSQGMLVLDGDVAVDPSHVATMLAAIDSDPGCVWTAPVKIWPTSTHRQDWVWAHWDDKASQELSNTAKWFSFNFTYLPAALLDHAIKAGMKRWVYPRVDANMSATAAKLGIKGRVVPECFPVHLHF